jgi:hypothetical protein
MTFKKDSSKVPNNKGLLVGETLIGTSVMVEVALCVSHMVSVTASVVIMQQGYGAAKLRQKKVKPKHTENLRQEGMLIQ